jgi:hypothetical protein
MRFITTKEDDMFRSHHLLKVRRPAVVLAVVALGLTLGSAVALADEAPAVSPDGPTRASVATPTQVAKLTSARSRRTHSRRLATYYVYIPTVETHAACNYSDPYGPAFGNSHQVVVWIPILNPIPNFGTRQRAYWRAVIYQPIVDAYGRTSWRSDSTPAAYTDFALFQPWFDLATGAFLGEAGHVPVLGAMLANQNIWVQDEYWFFNMNTGEYIHQFGALTKIC